MAVIIKSSNLAFLLKMGVELELVSQVKAAGITFELGYKDFKFLKQDTSLYVGMLPHDSNSLMKVTATQAQKDSAKAVLIEAIHSALSGLGPVSGTDKIAAAVSLVEEVQKDKGETTIAVNKSKNVIDDVIPLKDALGLYQRVKGTSGGSVYVLVAIHNGTTGCAKVAARVINNSLSVRVEGKLSEAVCNAFIAQGLDVKSGYMSGHFTCNDNVGPERVVGAILMGTGLEFSTPLPSMERVRKLSA